MASPAAPRTRRGAADLLGHRLDSFIHPEDLSRFGLVVDYAAPGSAARVELRFRRSDGSYRWVACRITAKVDAAGIPESVVGGLGDVQDRKVSEAKELDRLAELEQFQRLTVGRELKMIELKKEIEYLRQYRHAGGTKPDDQHGAVSSG